MINYHCKVINSMQHRINYYNKLCKNIENVTRKIDVYNTKSETHHKKLRKVTSSKIASKLDKLSVNE